MSEIDDYMNWFEATQMNTGSGNFTGYLKAVDQSQVPAPRRHDPLSVVRGRVGGSVLKKSATFKTIESLASCFAAYMPSFGWRKSPRLRGFAFRCGVSPYITTVQC